MRYNVERELGLLKGKLRLVYENRISGYYAALAPPVGGQWVKGDVVRNSDPTATITAGSTYFTYGWEYRDEGAGTLSWCEMRFWDLVILGGGGGFVTTTATNVGTGVGLYKDLTFPQLRFRSLKGGTDITITQSGDEVVISSLASAAAGPTPHVGSAVVDFGAFPGASDASVAVVGETSITANAVVNASIRVADSTDHSADEHRAEELVITAGSIVAGTGFTLYAKCANESVEPDAARSRVSTLREPRLYGQFNANWNWS